MRGLKFILVAGVAAVTLSACADRYQMAADTTPTNGTPFTHALYDGYVELSKDERDEQDWADSGLFADKAIASAEGQAVAPEVLADWDLDQEFVHDLSAARGRLIGALEGGAPEKYPHVAAKAQVMFDCWVQEQEENIQPEHIQRCRGAFENAMANLDAAMMAKAPEPAPAPAPEPMKIPDPYTIYFDFDSSELTEDAKLEVSVIAAAIKKIGPSKVFVSGHTDTAGASVYNQVLAERRAGAVSLALIEQGVAAAVLASQVHGEEAPAVATGDGVKEAKNRRVVVTLRK